MMNLKKESLLGSVGISILIVLLGTFIICCPLLKINDLNLVYRIFFLVYALIQLGQFLLLYKKKDYTNIFAFLISIFFLIISFPFNLVADPKIIALSLLVWILVIALVKLKKADYYHDHKSRVWCIEVGYLVMFLLSGVLTCLNFYNSTEIQILVLGYFVLICGILEVQESLLLYLTKGKLK